MLNNTLAKENNNTLNNEAQYDVSALSPKAFSNAPPSFIISAILGLRRFFLMMADIVVPADAAVFERVAGVGYTAVIGAITRLNIPDLLQEGPLNAEQIASKTNSNADAIHRAMRAAVTLGVFSLNKRGEFANNRLSKALISGQIARVKEFAEYFSSKSNCAAYAEFEHILKTGEEGFMKANKLDLWDWFDKYPRERETFAQMMMGVTNGEAPMIAKLYPFEEVKRICDVGGGRGSLLSELIIRYPHLEGVLFDCEGVIESAKPLLKARGVEDKIELVVGDFYQSIEPGCDVYMLKNVMHDWDDDRCKIILDNCHKVLPPGGKVLLVEILLEKNDRSNFAAFRDAHVLAVCTGGRERSRTDYEHLLKQSNFKMTRIFASPIISVIEGTTV